MSIFTGSAVAIVTPFKKDGSVDYDKFRDVIEYQIAGGTDCIVVCGTTGESSTLSQLFICLRKQRSMAWMVCLL